MFGLLTRTLTWKREATYDASMRPLPVIACLASAALLAGCGSGASAPETSSPAPIESASDPGDPAFFGTKGVEVKFVNTTGVEKSNFSVTIKDRNSSATWTLTPGQEVMLRGERNVSDDLEVKVQAKWAFTHHPNVYTDSFDMDFSNPTAYCPNVTVGDDNDDFCSVGAKESWSLPKAAVYSLPVSLGISVKRESDSSDFKRFTVNLVG